MSHPAHLMLQGLTQVSCLKRIRRLVGRCQGDAVSHWARDPTVPCQNLRMPWWLGHPPFRHCDTPTRTIRHCNDSPHKRLHIVKIQPRRGQTVWPPPNCSVRRLKSGSKYWLWQSDPFSAPRSRGGGGEQFGPRHTDGAVKKRHCATRENFTDAWVSKAQAWPNLTPNMARPTQQSSTSARVNGVLLGGVNHTPS